MSQSIVSGGGTPAYKLTWRGKEVEQALNDAILEGMIETLEACVMQAKVNAPVLTGQLRDDIDYRVPTSSASRFTGRWGNWLVPYSVYQELGWRGHPGRYYLRRAQDQEYPKMAERIKEAYAKSSARP